MATNRPILKIDLEEALLEVTGDPILTLDDKEKMGPLSTAEIRDLNEFLSEAIGDQDRRNDLVLFISAYQKSKLQARPITVKDALYPIVNQTSLLASHDQYAMLAEVLPQLRKNSTSLVIYDVELQEWLQDVVKESSAHIMIKTQLNALLGLKRGQRKENPSDGRNGNKENQTSIGTLLNI